MGRGKFQGSGLCRYNAVFKKEGYTSVGDNAHYYCVESVTVYLLGWFSKVVFFSANL